MAINAQFRSALSKVNTRNMESTPSAYMLEN